MDTMCCRQPIPFNPSSPDSNKEMDWTKVIAPYAQVEMPDIYCQFMWNQFPVPTVQKMSGYCSNGLIVTLPNK